MTRQNIKFKIKVNASYFSGNQKCIKNKTMSMDVADLSRRGQHSLQVRQTMKERGIGFLDNVSVAMLLSCTLCNQIPVNSV